MNTTLKASEAFKVGKHDIGYVSSGFMERFGTAEFAPRTLGTFQILSRYMTDKEIETELKPGLCELGDVLAFLENPPESSKNGYFNLFYLSSCVVYVHWLAGGREWRVSAWERDGYGWFAGSQVFSPATSNSIPMSSTLSPSKPLTLRKETSRQALTRIADALEVIATKLK